MLNIEPAFKAQTILQFWCKHLNSW